MTTEHEASRTLVKSPPELWAECSDAGSLARHLGEFGEIQITRLDPETTVAWEGEHASGTVRIEPSGWGTRVTLTAQTKAEALEAPPEIEAIEEAQPASNVPEGPPGEEEDDAAVEETAEGTEEVPVADTARPGAGWRRLKARFRRRKPESSMVEEDPGEALPEPSDSTPSPEPQPDPEPGPELELEPISESQPELDPGPELDPEGILASALDSLGQAHHRPFSRA